MNLIGLVLSLTKNLFLTSDKSWSWRELIGNLVLWSLSHIISETLDTDPV